MQQKKKLLLLCDTIKAIVQHDQKFLLILLFERKTGFRNVILPFCLIVSKDYLKLSKVEGTFSKSFVH